MREAVLELAARHAPHELVVVSHQWPIGATRVAFSHGLGTPRSGWQVRLLPKAFAGKRCSYASVTTLHLLGSALHHIDYWAPPQ